VGAFAARLLANEDRSGKPACASSSPAVFAGEKAFAIMARGSNAEHDRVNTASRRSINLD
jgi:hypothetical protein